MFKYMRMRVILSAFTVAALFLPLVNDARIYAQSGSGTLPVILQERLNQHMVDEDRRFQQIESFQDLMRAQAISTEKRLSTLEAMAESNIYWLRGIALSIVAIAIKEVFLYRVLRKDREQNDGVS
jgi:hypothetical protein